MMSARHNLEHAAELISRLIPTATPGPWRDSSVDRNRYAALVSDVCTRQCDEYARRPQTLDWMGHPHDGYGGCLVAESQTAADRRLMAVLRNIAEDLPGLLEAVAHEDVQALTHHARAIASSVLETHQPRHPAVTHNVTPE